MEPKLKKQKLDESSGDDLFEEEDKIKLMYEKFIEDHPLIKQPIHFEDKKFKNLVDKIYFPEKGDLNNQQYYILCEILQGRSLFISGEAGTGKSKLIRDIIKHLNRKDIIVETITPTGMAAFNLNMNAKTIHSWLHVGAKHSKNEMIEAIINANRRYKNNLDIVQVLIIEECSMVSPELFEIIDESLKRIKMNMLPFGGIQLICSGDFAQLPPIIEKGKQLVYLFETDLWKSIFKKENSLCLKHNYRQESDPEFQELLFEARRGEMSIDSIQKIMDRTKDKSKSDYPLTVLFCSNRQAHDMNEEKTLENQNEQHEYNWLVETPGFQTRDKQRFDSFLKEKETQIQSNLILKIGMPVMLRVNLNIEEGLVNGAIGQVIEFEDEDFYPVVRFKKRTVIIEPYIWTESTSKIYNPDNFKGFILTQIPLIPAYAFTIHKSQSLTIDNLDVDLKNVNQCGQAYVAISRARSLNSLSLKNLNHNSFKASKKVNEFYDSCVTNLEF